jgi:hypothetical protein
LLSVLLRVVPLTLTTPRTAEALPAAKIIAPTAMAHISIWVGFISFIFVVWLNFNAD